MSASGAEAQLFTYNCTLSADVERKAVAELGEKPEWRNRDIQALRDRVQANPNIACSLESAFLIKFLRARKFDYDRAYRLLCRYLDVRLQYPEIYDNFVPSAERELFECGITTRLPYRDDLGRTLIYTRPGAQLDGNIDAILRANLMQIETCLLCEAVQVNGVIIIFDFKDVGFALVRRMTLSVARRNSAIIQDAIPARVKALHMVNMPTLLEKIFNTFKSFLKEKLQNRIFAHSCLETVQEAFGQRLLPTQLGGTIDLTESQKAWAEEILGKEEYFKELSAYNIEPMAALSSEPDSSADAVTGTAGTFRKLNLD